MGFTGKFVGFVGSVLLCSVAVIGQSSVTVVVNNSAKVRSDVLRRAEAEAARLFQAAGVSIRWLHCGEADACQHVLLPNELVLHIVHTGKTQSEFVFGEAFLGDDGRGQYCDVFFDRVKAAPGNTDVGPLLGVIAAHELAHLLLGSRAHSRIGIMQAVCEQDCVRKIAMGILAFTPEQARLMKLRIGQADRLQLGLFAKTEGEIGLLGDWTPAPRF